MAQDTVRRHSSTVLLVAWLLCVLLMAHLAEGKPRPRPSSRSDSMTMTFTAMAGGQNPSAQTFTLTNTGAATLEWGAQPDVGWLKLTPASGSISVGASSTVIVAVDISTLTPTTYTGTISLSTPRASNQPQPISVTLLITGEAPTISHNPIDLSFVGTQGGANPTPQTFSIRNTGTGTLNWSLSETASWLTVSPTSGTLTTGSASIGVSVNTTGLSDAQYTTSIIVSDPSASNTPKEIPVTLLLLTPLSSSAVLNWAANTETDLAGYKVYAGTASGSYSTTVDVGNVTTFKLINLLQGHTYYFAITAYDTAGNESGYSNEVSKTIL